MPYPLCAPVRREGAYRRASAILLLLLGFCAALNGCERGASVGVCRVTFVSIRFKNGRLPSRLFGRSMPREWGRAAEKSRPTPAGSGVWPASAIRRSTFVRRGQPAADA